MFDTVLVTGPTVEPITSTQAKTFLGITDSGSDAIIAICVAGARGKVEDITQRKLITQTHYLYLKDWPAAGDKYIDPEDQGDFIQLPFGNISSITSIEYRGTDGTWATWDASNYILDNSKLSGRVYLGYNASWPTSVLYVGNPIRVKFVCGYGAAGSNVPDALLSAIYLAIGELFNNRRFDPQDNEMFMDFVTPYILPWVM